MKWFYSLIAVLMIGNGFAQQTETVDFERIYALLDFNFTEGTVSGDMEVKFTMLDDADFVYLDAKNITRYESLLNDKLVGTHTDDGRIIFTQSFAKGQTYHLKLKYTAKPDRALYFVNNGGFQQIWTQGQGKYTSNWLPSIDDMNDKIEFDLSIVAYPGQEVISNGVLKEKEEVEDKFIWHYEMSEPMSSYLVAVVLGDYRKQKRMSESDIPIELYYYPEDSMKVMTTYRYTDDIFDYFEEEIGVGYPWPNYKQVPVKDFLYAGMENTTATVFSDHYMVDRTGFTDRNYVAVNAHELAHQWFGDFVTETSGTHHWLQEGFATYYALLAERKFLGDDEFYWKLYESAEQLEALCKQGKGENLQDPNASSLTFYEKGAWALFALKNRIGEEAFKTAVKNYLNAHKFSNVETEDFLKEARAASGEDLIDYTETWIESTTFPYAEAQSILADSPVIQRYKRVVALRPQSFGQKQNKLFELLALPDKYSGREAIYQLAKVPASSAARIYERAFYTNNSWVRQAIAESITNVPAFMKVNYERLLNDDSYLTREYAFFNLWKSFPADRHKYLDKMKGVQGFADHNLEILWLALAISTLDYEEAYIRDHFFRLTRFTGNRYGFETRLNAFEKLYQLTLYEPKSLANLVEACFHHNWRFSQACKAILDEVVKNPDYRRELEKLKFENPKEQALVTEKLL